MKSLQSFIILALLLVLINAEAQITAIRRDSVVRDSADLNTIPYRTRNSWIIVPVKINDTLKVNLILDPRSRSVILFGKRYEKALENSKRIMLAVQAERTPDSITPNNLHHKIAIGPAVGENIPIVVVPNKNPVNFFDSVHGVIGYDILKNFAIELDPKNQLMTLTPTKEEQNVFYGLLDKVNNYH